MLQSFTYGEPRRLCRNLLKGNILMFWDKQGIRVNCNILDIIFYEY